GRDKLDRVVPILLQVKVTDEPKKSGVAVAAVTHLTEQLCSLKNLAVHGMMALAPLSDDEKIVRLAMERARELFDEIVADRYCGPEFKEFSLGMTNDFEHAIEFGSTYVRIGSALFEGIELSAETAPIGS
ncbi:MAG: alanine racemase, partial [Planctomycetes bacterium]|nr:alanine racemase [Planctomycetota bacterium]